MPITPEKYKRVMIVYVKGAAGAMDALVQMAMGGGASQKNPAEDLRDRLIEKGFDAFIYESPIDKMKKQIERAYLFAGKSAESAETTVKAFMEALPCVRDTLFTDLQATFEGDPAAKSKEEIVFSYPGFYAIFVYRVAHILYLEGVPFIPRMMTEYAHNKTGIDIHPGATIGRGLFIDHGHGVVIGETAIVGDNVTLYQGVTLGGTGKESGKRHPTIGDNVMISAGAKILGSIEIGDNCKIGAGSVVLSPVPSNCTVVGIPGRIVKRNNISCPSMELNQVDLPDPIKEDINELKNNKNAMEERVQELEAMVQKLADMVAKNS